MRSLLGFLASGLIFSRYFWWTFCMNSSLGFGKKYLFTYWEYCKVLMALQISWTTGKPVLLQETICWFHISIRFRAVPTFGRDSIRKFTNNVSELKKLGARDYENLLQVGTAHSLKNDSKPFLISAPYQCSRVFFQNHTTRIYWMFYLR